MNSLINTDKEITEFYFGIKVHSYGPDKMFGYEVVENYSDVSLVINIKKDNVVDVVDYFSPIIINLNNNLLANLESQIKELIVQRNYNEKWTYVPICRVMLCEVNSHEPYQENEVLSVEKLFDKFQIEVKKQDRLSKTFYLRIKLDQFVSRGGDVDVAGLKLHLCHVIQTQLLDIIDEMKKEESYTTHKVCDIIDKISTHHELLPSTVKKAIPCRIGDLQKLGIETV